MVASRVIIKRWLSKAFNTKILQYSRLQWIDYLRGIAILLVVYFHALTGIKRSNIAVPEYLTTANMIFYSFRMPLFFILSGIFISRSLAKKPAHELIGIKFEKLLYPYLVWAFIQVSLQIIFGHFTNSSRGLEDYSYILYHPRNLDQFWYLPALFNTTMVYLLIQHRFKPGAWTQLVFGTFLFFLSPYFQQVSMMSDWMEFYIFFAIGNVVSQFFFREAAQKFLKDPLSFLLIIPVFIAVQLYYLKHDVGSNTLLTDLRQIKENYFSHMLNQIVFLFIALVGCLTMFKLAFLLQRWRLFSFLRILGYHSLYIYVMHVIVTGFIRLVLPSVFGIHDPAVLLFTAIFFGITLPIIFYNLAVKDNAGWFLFSYRKKSKAVTTTLPQQDARPSVVAQQPAKMIITSPAK